MTIKVEIPEFPKLVQCTREKFDAGEYDHKFLNYTSQIDSNEIAFVVFIRSSDQRLLTFFSKSTGLTWTTDITPVHISALHELLPGTVISFEPSA